MADDRHGTAGACYSRCPRRWSILFVRGEPATKLRTNAHDVEVLSARRQDAYSVRTISSSDVGARFAVGVDRGRGLVRRHPPEGEIVHRRHEASTERIRDVALEDANQLSRLLIWERLQEHRVDRAEYGRRSTDANRESEDRDECEAGTARQRAQRERDVGRCILEQASAACVADVVLHAFDAAERDEAVAVRVGVVLTRSLSILRFHFDVRAQLFGELAFLAVPK